MEHPRERTKNTQEILIDADAFVALMVEEDASHQRAVDTFTQLENQPIRFFTSNYVFSEVVTVISQKAGREPALQFIDTLTSPSSAIRIVRPNLDIDNRALEWFKTQTSKNVSFVDCANMALLQIFDTEYIFSFDSIYRKNGFRLAEELIGERSK